MKPPKLAIYCRVSSEGQKHDDTILRQIENASEWLKHTPLLTDRGGPFELLHRFPVKNQNHLKSFFMDDGFNLETWDPKSAFADLMKRVENSEVQAIFVSEADRLFRARDRVVLAQTLNILERREIRIFTKMGEVPLGIALDITSSVSAQDKRNTMAKLHEGKIQRTTQEGRPPGGRVALGFKWDRLGKVWSIVDDEAQIVRWVVKATIGKNSPDMPVQLGRAVQDNPDGVSDRLIAQAFADAGVTIKSFLERSRFKHMLEKNPTGKISEILLSNIFRDDKYIGKYSYRLRSPKQVGKIEYKDLPREAKTEIIVKVPQIITDVEEWNLAKRLRAERKRTSSRNVASEYLLKDLLHCAVCGNRLAARQGKKVYRRRSDGLQAETRCLYYTCRRKPKIHSQRCSAATCHNAAVLDPAIWDQVREVILNPGTMRAIEDSSRKFESVTPIESLERQVAEVQKTLNDLDEQRKRVNTGFAQGLFDQMDAAEQRERIAADKARAEKLQDQVEHQIREQKRAEEQSERVDLKKVRRQYASRLDNLTFEQRQTVVRMIVNRVEITPEKTVQTVFRPF